MADEARDEAKETTGAVTGDEKLSPAGIKDSEPLGNLGNTLAGW